MTGRTRKCERCGYGTETCTIGDFYTCNLCDHYPDVDPCADEDTQETTITWTLDAEDHTAEPWTWGDDEDV